ncbi:MAG: DNA-directed RNA polymerase subunit H [Nanoarchaeota archaeon]
MAKKQPIITKHLLVPKHLKLSEREKEELFKRYNISLKELPKILKEDSAIAELDVKVGDIIKIIRKSHTAGESIFYRGVSDV